MNLIIRITEHLGRKSAPRRRRLRSDPCDGRVGAARRPSGRAAGQVGLTLLACQASLGCLASYIIYYIILCYIILHYTFNHIILHHILSYSISGYSWPTRLAGLPGPWPRGAPPGRLSAHCWLPRSGAISDALVEARCLLVESYSDSRQV